jgi:UDP-glucose 4-epimerase
MIIQEGVDKGQSSRRVLVTGGAGFIGANLVRVLLKRGCAVTVLDDLSTGRVEYLKDLPIQFLQGDILDWPTVRRAVAGQDGVVHLAAQTGVSGSISDPRRDCEVNVLGTLNLLEACRAEMAEVKGKKEKLAYVERLGSRFVFASSNAPLGRQAPPASEDKAGLPISPYGASKLAGEAYCLAYEGTWQLETVALRFGNVYGPFSSHKSSVIARFFKDILSHGNVILDGDGEQTRDFIYVQDLCKAIVLALESETKGEIFQIATGVETSVRTLATLVQQATGQIVGVNHGPARQGDMRRNYSSIAKARHILGWEPSVGLAAGLRETWNWFDTFVSDDTRTDSVPRAPSARGCSSRKGKI